jgi:hypothetical protein
MAGKGSLSPATGKGKGKVPSPMAASGGASLDLPAVPEGASAPLALTPRLDRRDAGTPQELEDDIAKFGEYPRQRVMNSLTDLQKILQYDICFFPCKYFWLMLFAGPSCIAPLLEPRGA